jgi:hypothetical protein
MIGRAVILDDSTPVEVTLKADAKGQCSLGIRINGSDERIMALVVTLPQPGCSNTWSKPIGDLM